MMNELSKDLIELKNPKYFDKFRNLNIDETSKKLQNSLKFDILVIQSVSVLEDVEKTINLLSRRLREWYGYYFPELERKISDNETFVELILNHSKEDLMKKYDFKISIGYQYGPEDVESVLTLAKEIKKLFDFKKIQLAYLEKLADENYPNVKHLVGNSLGAKLITLAGSFEKLAFMPASTVQLLGAEKALFRHLKDKTFRPPKHGILLNHPLVLKQKRKDKGRVARALADKISIAARVDYFKGQFVADKLNSQLMEKFK